MPSRPPICRQLPARFDLKMHVRLIRPTLRSEDEFLRAVRRSRALHAKVVSPPRSSAEYRQYVRSCRKQSRECFLVSIAESDELAGVVNINEIVRGCFQSGYLGYYAFVPFAGTGLMRQGLRLAINHCFARLRLHRLEANIQPENARSISLVRGLGFKLEGLSPRYLKICGRWQDHQRWAILSEQWRGSKPARKQER